MRLSTEGTYENDPVGSGPLTDLAPGLVDDDIGDAEKNDEGGQGNLVPQLALHMGSMTRLVVKSIDLRCRSVLLSGNS